MHRQPVGQRAFAEILFQQMGLARVEFAKRGYNLVQFGLHVALPKTFRHCEDQRVQPLAGPMINYATKQSSLLSCG